MEPLELYKVWDRFERSNISELEYENGNIKIRLKKPDALRTEYVRDTSNSISSDVSSSGLPISQNEAVLPKDDRMLPENETAVKAPFIGTFYRSPAPGTDPYVTIGQKVNKGDVIGIIEAMKLMNEITAPISGTLTSIFVEDETLVGFDDLLMGISC